MAQSAGFGTSAGAGDRVRPCSRQLLIRYDKWVNINEEFLSLEVSGFAGSPWARQDDDPGAVKPKGLVGRCWVDKR
jgi:hypothetical protein